MSGLKRAHPLGYAEGAGSREPAAKLLKQDAAAVYEATLNKLKLGARAATTGGGPRSSASHPRVSGKQHDFEGGSSSNGVVAHVENQQSLVRVTSNSPFAMAGLTSSSSSTHALPTTTPQRNVSAPRPCYVCMSQAADNMCFHCSRGCCEKCSRRCEGCQELFCSICSTSNYNERYDRSFCFDCNAKASHNHSNLPIRSTFNDEARDMEFF